MQIQQGGQRRPFFSRAGCVQARVQSGAVPGRDAHILHARQGRGGNVQHARIALIKGARLCRQQAFEGRAACTAHAFQQGAHGRGKLTGQHGF